MRKFLAGLLLGASLMCGGGWAAPAQSSAKAQELEAVYKRAQDEFKAGEWDKAMHDFEIVHAAAPLHQTTMLYLGISYRESGDLPKAESTFRTLEKVAPRLTQAHMQMVDILIRQKKYNDARTEVKAVQDYDPNNTQAHYVLGNIAYAQGFLSEATDEWQKTTAAYDGYAPAHHNLGWAYFEQREFNLANAQFQRALQLQSHAPMYEFALGYVAYANDENSKAATMFDLVRTDGGGTVYGLIADAIQALVAKQADVAIDKAQKAVDKQPDLTQGWVVLARAYQQKGDLVKARQAADKALDSDSCDWESKALVKALPPVPPPTPTPADTASPTPGWTTPGATASPAASASPGASTSPSASVSPSASPTNQWMTPVSPSPSTSP